MATYVVRLRLASEEEARRLGIPLHHALTVEANDPILAARVAEAELRLNNLGKMIGEIVAYRVTRKR
jgi:hypothetical protein